MAAATESMLGDLHEFITKALNERLAQEQVDLAEGLAPNASTMNAAIAFLKHNNITCAAEDSDEQQTLQQQLASRRKRSVHDISMDDIPLQ